MPRIKRSERHPDNGKAHGNLGAALGELGRWNEAADCNRLALQLEPSATHAYNLGMDLTQLGLVAEAEQAFRQALEFEPQSPDIRVRLAVTMSLGGRLDEAVALLAQPQGSRIGSGAEWADLIYALLRTGQIEDALRTARRAVEQYPDRAVVQAALGWALVHAERPEEAAGSFDRALALAPRDPAARALAAPSFSASSRSIVEHWTSSLS